MNVITAMLSMCFCFLSETRIPQIINPITNKKKKVEPKEKGKPKSFTNNNSIFAGHFAIPGMITI